MKLCVARHGQTDWNRRDVICGRTDLPLTDEGRLQAEKLADAARKAGVDTVWASPLLRAKETAEIVGRRLGVPVRLDERLLEQDFGDFEETYRFDPAYLEYRKNFFLPFPGGGESIAMVAARAYSVAEDIRCHYPDRTILLVTHGAFCRALNTLFHPTKNEDFYAFRLQNCQMAEYEF